MARADFLFIHINKTGGTSIRKALGWPALDTELGINTHKPARFYIKKIGIEKWQSQYTFTIVRNPWDKVVSHYHYRLRKKWLNESLPFEKWVMKTYGHERTGFTNKFFAPQMTWITYQGEVMVNFVGRFESINADFQIICKKLGVSKTLPHLNKTKRGEYREYYTAETRQAVADWFQPDIEEFNYKF